MPRWHIQGVHETNEVSDRFLGRLVMALHREGAKVTARTDDRVLFRFEQAGGAFDGVQEGEVYLFRGDAPDAPALRHRILHRLSLDRLVSTLYLTMTLFLGGGLVGGLVLTGGLHVESAFWCTPVALPLAIVYLVRKRRLRRTFATLLEEARRG